MNPMKTVLLAEDEDNDVFMMQRTVRKMGAPISLQVAHDGEEAIEYLSGQKKFADRDLYPLPQLIMLDIKMPRKSGFDVLAWLKGKSSLSHIPVVMHSSSKVKSDVDRAYDLGASAYLVKPASFADLEKLFKATEEFLSTHTLMDHA